MSTFTVSKNLEQVARGGDLGTWDTPENSNWAIVDAALGGSVAIPLNNSNVLLSSPQFQSNLITFNSTLTGSVIITFPSTFTGTYVIQNLCTGTSAFTITLATTVAGGQVIGCKPGEPFDVLSDGTNLKFYNLDHTGTYWDYAGSSVPSWVSACTVPPYLNCDGTTFSAATYPALATVLGSTTLPDSRGRARFAITQGTARVSSGISGIIGAVAGSAGGNEALTSHNHVNVLNDPSHLHGNSQPTGISAGPPGELLGGGNSAGTFNWNTVAAVTGMTITNAFAGAGASQNMPPAYMGGLTLIRSA